MKTTLRELCTKGAKRLNIDLTNPDYAARLERELEVIEKKGFADYFFVVAEMCHFAKKIMLVGPGRGSSGGSLVCYLLNITTIDPLKFGLLFERFLDEDRTELPDVDCDFSADKRDKVFEFAEKRYGKDHVSRLGSVNQFKPRSALNTAGKALKIPIGMIEKTLDGLIERSSGDSRAMFCLQDTIESTEAGQKLLRDFPEVAIINRLEGHPQHSSQHAAGLLLTQEPMLKFVAIDTRTGASCCDKKDCDALGLLKIDVLGLTQLSIFEQTLRLLGIDDTSSSMFFENLPLDDQAAFDVINKGHFCGVFQMEGRAVQVSTKQIKIDNINDIITITALARPGPLAGGAADSWIRRRNGVEAATVVHPSLSKYVSETYGIIVYQEQVINIVKNIANLSWKDTNSIRKAMSNTLGDEYFAQFEEKFVTGCEANGIDRATGGIIWKNIARYGSWSFNKSHSVAYGLVCYYSCYLKAHYPVEFAAATLDAQTDTVKQLQMLRELATEGIDYIPLDKDVSTDHWTPTIKDGKKILVGPLTLIKGIGPKNIIQILDARKHNKPLSKSLTQKLEAGRTEIDDLFPITTAYQRLKQRHNIASIPTPVKDIQPGVFRFPICVVGVFTRIVPRDENEPVLIAKRGGKVKTGKTAFLNLFLSDDTDEVYMKISVWDYERLAIDIIERGKKSKAMYAIKGPVMGNYRGIEVKNVLYLGDIDE